MLGVNVGCGATPVPGWVNLDNSLTVKLARTPLARFMGRGDFASAITRHEVRWADATRLPLTDKCVDVLYSSHMLEHLSRAKADEFMKEARRVLKPRGILRLVLPDLRMMVDKYLESGDADQFMERTLLSISLDTRKQRLSAVMNGNREHQWLYDGASLTKLLARHGFENIVVLQAGETTIPDINGLDLREREEESVYVEGAAPV
jgi:predicted SAM-dependent methyltransferase